MNRLQSIAPGIDVEVWEIGLDAIAALGEGKSIWRSRMLGHCGSISVLMENCDRLEWFGLLIRREEASITYWQYADL
jgi:alkylated DNA repair dioxygenase AlkB